MSEGLLYELTLTGMGFLTGVGLMMVYDVLRVFRLFIRHRPLLTGLEDFVFWVYAALITFGLLYDLNEGILRSYVIFVVLLGMILYDRICSRFWLKLLKNVRKYIRIKILPKIRIRKQ